MIGDEEEFDELENDELDEADDEESDDSEEDLGDLGTETAVGLTGEYNIDELVAKLDSTDPAEIARRREIRRRLEEIRELRNADLDSTFNFRLDDDEEDY